jgi:hypothetical protein
MPAQNERLRPLKSPSYLGRTAHPNFYLIAIRKPNKWFLQKERQSGGGREGVIEPTNPINRGRMDPFRIAHVRPLLRKLNVGSRIRVLGAKRSCKRFPGRFLASFFWAGGYSFPVKTRALSPRSKNSSVRVVPAAGVPPRHERRR